MHVLIHVHKQVFFLFTHVLLHVHKLDFNSSMYVLLYAYIIDKCVMQVCLLYTSYSMTDSISLTWGIENILL